MSSLTDRGGDSSSVGGSRSARIRVRSVVRRAIEGAGFQAGTAIHDPRGEQGSWGAHTGQMKMITGVDGEEDRVVAGHTEARRGNRDAWRSENGRRARDGSSVSHQSLGASRRQACRPTPRIRLLGRRGTLGSASILGRGARREMMNSSIEGVEGLVRRGGGGPWTSWRSCFAAEENAPGAAWCARRGSSGELARWWTRTIFASTR